VNTTVAIVGTHPITRAMAPFTDKTKDIWIFNNQILQGWCPRADVCLDIHPPEDIYRRGKEHPQFQDWLMAKKGLKYITPVAMPDIPDNEIYPLDEVIADLLPNFKRGDKANQYFTSGPCYALALAIHMGYKRIEMYGVEMESNAEYVYQRDGVGLYFGIALGRGIEVVIPKESMMFYAPLYGFQADATKIDREAFEVRGTELQEAMAGTLAKYNQVAGAFDALNNRIVEANKRRAPEDELIELQKEFNNAINALLQATADHAFVNGQYIDTRSWQAKVDKALEFSGHAQEILAQNNDKWGRMDDKITLTGKLGDVTLPENLKS
jgi:hypothetical protein